MSNNVESVISALRVALTEAEKRGDMWWKVQKSNRWTQQLPGAWAGRWRHLTLSGDHAGEILRIDFIEHVKATLAYLEANRDAIQSIKSWSWPFAKAPQSAPIEAEYKDITNAQKTLDKPVRLIKR